MNKKKSAIESLEEAVAVLKAAEPEQSITGFINSKDACKFLGGIGRTHLWHLTRQEGLPVHHLGKRILFSPKELADFVQSQAGKEEK